MTDGDTVAAAARRRIDAVPVLILNYNGWDDTFANIATMTPYLPNLWLIDNGSDEDLTAEAVRRFPALRVLRNPSNLGWAGGYNRALAQVAADGYAHAYLLNSDAVAEAGAVERAVAAFDDDVAAVGSVILAADGRINFAGEYFFFLGERERDAAAAPAGVVAARTLHGAGVAVSLRAIAELGPFPEDHFLYWEEAEWFIRATQRGWRLRLDGGSRVGHRGEASGTGTDATYYRTRNRFLAWRRGISISGRRESFADLVDEQLRVRAWASPPQWHAARQGLVDGVIGRFGRRPSPLPAALVGSAVEALRLLVLPRRIGRRIAARLGS